MRFFRNLKALQTPFNTALLLAYFQAHSGPPLRANSSFQLQYKQIIYVIKSFKN